MEEARYLQPGRWVWIKKKTVFPAALVGQLGPGLWEVFTGDKRYITVAEAQILGPVYWVYETADGHWAAGPDWEAPDGKKLIACQTQKEADYRLKVMIDRTAEWRRLVRQARGLTGD